LDFAFSSSTPPQSVNAGDKTQFNYVLEATNGTLPDVQLSCSGLPQGATCSFDNLIPGQITVGWMTIQTTARTSAALHANRLMFFALMIPFGFVALPGGRRRRLLYVGLLLLVFAVILQSGCAGGSSTSSTSNSNGPGSTSAPGVSGADNGGSTGGGTTTGGDTGTGSAGSGSGSGSSGSGSGTGSGGSGGGTTSTGTPAGTYQVTITATGDGVTHTQAVTLVVQ